MKLSRSHKITSKLWPIGLALFLVAATAWANGYRLRSATAASAPGAGHIQAARFSASALTVPINNVSVSAIQTDSVVVRWDSTSPGTSQIEYGLTTAYGSLTAEEALSHFHTTQFAGLAENTAYHFLIRSKDHNGAESISSDYTFTTITQAAMESIIRAARTNGDLPKTYYVRTGGSDAQDGLTIGTAWQHPGYAASIADVGDLVYLIDDPADPNDGVWSNEHVVFTRSGIDIAPIVMKAYSGSPTLDGLDKSGNGIDISGKSHVKVMGVALKRYDTAIYLLSPCCTDVYGLRIDSNHIEDVNSGVFFENINRFVDIAVENNEFLNVSSAGFEAAIAPQGIYRGAIRNNTITNGRNGILNNQHDEYVLIEGNHMEDVYYRVISFYTSEKVSVVGNTILNTTGPDGRSIRFDYNCRNILIFSNTVQNGGAGLQIYPGTTFIFKSNFYDNSLVRAEGTPDDVIPPGSYALYNLMEDNVIINSDIWIIGGSGEGKHKLFFRRNRIENAGAIDLHSIGDGIFSNNVFIGEGVLTGYAGDPSDKITFSNNVFYNILNASYTGGRAIWLYNIPVTSLIVENNIFSRVESYSVDNSLGLGSNVTVSYNDVWNSGAFNSVTATHTLNVDPLFADPAAGDFHLKSQIGRWNGSKWVKDTVHSPAIDAGDPASPYNQEPSPNGCRINMGAYGNTSEASWGRSLCLFLPLILK